MKNFWCSVATSTLNNLNINHHQSQLLQCASHLKKNTSIPLPSSGTQWCYSGGIFKPNSIWRSHKRELHVHRLVFRLTQWTDMHRQIHSAPPVLNWAQCWLGSDWNLLLSSEQITWRLKHFFNGKIRVYSPFDTDPPCWSSLEWDSYSGSAVALRSEQREQNIPSTISITYS